MNRVYKDFNLVIQNEKLMFRSLVLSGVALALSFALAAPVLAEELSKEQCAVLQLRKNTLLKAGVAKNMEKGAKWAKDHLKPEDLAEIKSYLHVKEQLMFRCSQKPEVEDEEEDQSDGESDSKDEKDDAKDNLKNVKAEEKPVLPAADKSADKADKKILNKKQDEKTLTPQESDKTKETVKPRAENVPADKKAENSTITGFQTTVTVKTRPKALDADSQILQDAGVSQASGQGTAGQPEQVTIPSVQPSEKKVPDAILGLDGFNSN